MDEENQAACLNAVFAKMVTTQDFSLKSLSRAFKDVLPEYCSMKYVGANILMFREAIHAFVAESTSEVMVKNRKAAALAEHLPSWGGKTAAAADVLKSPKEKAPAASTQLTDQEAEMIVETARKDMEALDKEAADMKSRQEALQAKKTEVAAQKKKAEEALKTNRLAAEREKQRSDLKRSLEESVPALSLKKAKTADFKSYFLKMDEESREELVASGVCSAEGDFTERVALTKKTRDEFKNRDLRALEDFGVIEKS